MAITLPSYAKLNLTLEVLDKRPDNYHNIQSVMHQINLKDDITLEKAEAITVKCPGIPQHFNLAYKAAHFLQDKYKVIEGCEITIKKNIPVAAGMAGGSSNAATVLKGLNQLWNLNLKDYELIAIATSLGSDIPFHLQGKTCLVENKGEKVTPLHHPKLHFLIINPGIEIATPYAYAKLDTYRAENKKPIPMHTLKMLEAINNNEDIKKHLHNDFEPVIFKKYPLLQKIKEQLIKEGLAALMSGSGSTIFAIGEKEELLKASTLFKEYSLVTTTASV